MFNVINSSIGCCRYTIFKSICYEIKIMFSYVAFAIDKLVKCECRSQSCNDEACVGGVPEPLELEPFLALEPPMSATDYGFCLDHDEGLAELFDFEF